MDPIMPDIELKPVNPELVSQCILTLESLLEDRIQLGELDPEMRKKLMIAAGRLSRPTRMEVMKLAKRHRRKLEKQLTVIDRNATANTEIRRIRTSSVFTAPVKQLGARTDTPELNNPRNCYVCKVEFKQLHFFYDAMCIPCGDFNYQKRFLTGDLRGKVALITGARVKIGFQAALLMLRAGAHVLVSTRFPRDAALRFSKEKDFSDWKSRIEIHGLDLRHSPSVELFTQYLNRTLKQLDILINNAAQTVRRPPGFYKHLVVFEELNFESLPTEIQPLLFRHEECKGAVLGHSKAPEQQLKLVDWKNVNADMGLQHSARLSQLPYNFDTTELDPELFPEGARDADLQQVDLRKMNSWRLKLADVSTAEMVEVQLVNAFAPFILCSKLKPLMVRAPGMEKHIVNVTAMEGKFARYTKTDKHPHTNMAKAALNMMTLTSAKDYIHDGIHMNAVDTGWVTDEDPIEISKRKEAEHDFQPPLDIVDGAARIVDPFFDGINTGTHIWGKFLKDYKPTEW